jgi:hypothetical protein
MLSSIIISLFIITKISIFLYCFSTSIDRNSGNFLLCFSNNLIKKDIERLLRFSSNDLYPGFAQDMSQHKKPS